jgi:hypothetical protein
LPVTNTGCVGVGGGVWLRAWGRSGPGWRLAWDRHTGGGATCAREQPEPGPEQGVGPKSRKRPHTCLLPARKDARDGTEATAEAQVVRWELMSETMAGGQPDVTTSCVAVTARAVATVVGGGAGWREGPPAPPRGGREDRDVGRVNGKDMRVMATVLVLGNAGWKVRKLGR